MTRGVAVGAGAGAEAGGSGEVGAVEEDRSDILDTREGLEEQLS